jgi:hypothetical protein
VPVLVGEPVGAETVAGAVVDLAGGAHAEGVEESPRLFDGHGGRAHVVIRRRAQGRRGLADEGGEALAHEADAGEEGVHGESVNPTTDIG